MQEHEKYSTRLRSEVVDAAELRARRACLDSLRSAPDNAAREPPLPLDDRLRHAIAASLDEAGRRIAATLESHLEDLRDLDNSDPQDQESALEEAVNAARLSAQETLRTSLEQARVEADRRVEQAYEEGAAAAIAQERASHRARVERFVAAVRAIDQATALGDVLDQLAQGLAGQTSRSAVLLVRERLTGWRVQGFGAHDAAPRRLDLARSASGVLGAAIERGRAVSTHEPEGSDGPMFARVEPGHLGVAAPVMVGGRAVAVVYAEGPASVEGDSATSPWPDVLDLLARYASRCLATLTEQRASGTTRRTAAVSSAAPQR